VPAAWVVEALDEFEDGKARFTRSPKTMLDEQFALKNRVEALARRVVVATDSIEGRTPASLQRVLKAIDVYCVPWSE